MHIFGGLYMKRLLSVALAFLLMLGLASPALAAKAKAVTMRVELVEGSVTIKDAGGVALDYFEGIQLYSGYSVETGDDSCAYISLDEDKAIKLAMNTTVTIKKSGRKLQVKLRAGEIVFNVTTPLAGNETLEIRTSTMITGVRGSSGGVNAETGEIFYGTGHGIVWFRETDQTSSLYGLSQRTELWGGRIVSVNWPVKDMELSDFSALFLGEVAENPDLQNSLKMEGRFDPQDMINLLPLILEAEIAAREEAKSSAVPLPESATDSPVNGDNVNPAFNNNWDLPTIVTPPPIIDLDDFIIPDDPMNPDEPETTAYTVTWQDEDGTILETDKNVPVGTVPEFNGSDPIKAADAQYTYTFAGWDSIPAAVAGDAVYTATYSTTTNTYTVTWKQDDDTVINTTTVAYGEVPTHAAPTKAADAQYTYTFAGWNTTPVAVTGNATYTATYSTTTNTYTITWKQDDGSVIDSTTVAYGVVPTHTDPTKAADAQYTYTFAGWSPEVSDVTGDETYTATYTETLNKYTVTWKDENGNVLETDENVAYGSTPSFDAENPTKAADAEYTYTFAGWDPTPVAVTGDAEYTAKYSSTVNYTVTFQDWNGTLIDSASYASGTEGSMIEIPVDPAGNSSTRATYVFNGWYNGTEVITDIAEDIGVLSGNVTYTADYTVTYDLEVILNEAIANTDFTDEFSFYGHDELKTRQTGQTAQFTISMEHTKLDYGDYNYVISLNGTPLTGPNVGFDETEELVACSFTVPNCRDNPDMKDGLEITVEKVYLASISSGVPGLKRDHITASGTGLMDDPTLSFGPAEPNGEELAYFYIYSGGQVAFTVNFTDGLPSSPEYGSYKYVVDPFVWDDTYETFNGFHNYDGIIIYSADCSVTKVLLVENPDSAGTISEAASEAAENNAMLVLTGEMTVNDESEVSLEDSKVLFSDKFTLNLNHDLVFEGEGFVYKAPKCTINRSDECIILFDAYADPVGFQETEYDILD